MYDSPVLACRSRIRIGRAYDDARQTGGNDGVRAGWSFSVVSAGLERDVEGGPSRTRSGAMDGFRFHMRAPAGLRPAARDHFAGVDISNYGPDRRIGRRLPEPAAGEPQGNAHHIRIEAAAHGA